jgi:hypothetical protein
LIRLPAIFLFVSKPTMETSLIFSIILNCQL